jgi:hypothetical protein
MWRTGEDTAVGSTLDERIGWENPATCGGDGLHHATGNAFKRLPFMHADQLGKTGFA